ncbi:MAG: DUF1653 domain-containing protein [Flavipsychrobacter sp.]|nr:DUF1653 domain-containing protein [Flavipsychrobacter sp.]
MQLIPGFYYHYKHVPERGVHHYAYEVLGAGSHTEKEQTSPDKYVAVYRPLYESSYGNEMYAIRPLAMFLEQVEVNGEQVPRFRKIEDESVIAELERIRNRMYP